MVTSTMTFISDVDVVISYRRVKSWLLSNQLCPGTRFKQAGYGKKSSCVMQSILLVLQLFLQGVGVLEGFTATASEQMRFNLELSAQQMHRWPWDKDCIQIDFGRLRKNCICVLLGMLYVSRGARARKQLLRPLRSSHVFILISVAILICKI